MGIYYLPVLTVVLGLAAGSQDLASIRYRFTPCGEVGRNGPSFSQCMSWYEQQNSPIANSLFRFVSDNLRIFAGSQGFRIPRTDWYNITVAGAAGGRGICSTSRGKGLLWKGVVELRDNQDLLIIVGQKGDEPCEVQKDIPVCASPPKNIDEGVECSVSWEEWLNSNPTLSLNAAFSTLNYGGGGGGGGASMVRIRDRQTEQFSALPIVVSGGGGGSASNTTLSILDTINITFPDDVPTIATDEELYAYFINAKTANRDITLEDVYNFTGIRGYVSNTVDSISNRPGAGGGYFRVVSLPQDGLPLSVTEDTAVGGSDCLHLSIDLSQRPLIESVHGGFGGGGGQCETGGSGGGFTGGSVFSNQFFGIPGNGGYFSFFSQPLNEVTEVSVGLNKELDGFVELIPTHCGCGYECIIDEGNQTFECICPDNTTLADNQFDCYEEVTIDVTEYLHQSTTKDISIKFLSFNKSLEIFSVSSEVMIGDMQGISRQPICTLLFVNDKGEVVLMSNTVRVNGGLIQKLSSIVTNFSNPDFQPFLKNPSLVSGAALVGDSSCDVLQLNISVSLKDPESVNVTVDFDKIAEVGLNIQNTPTYRINDEVPTTLPPGNSLTPWLFLIISITLLVPVMVLIVIVVPASLYVRYRRRKKRVAKRKTTGGNTYTQVIENSMVNNVLYNGLRCSGSDSASTDRSKLRDSLRSFKPKFDINVPHHNFSDYNKLRRADQDWEYSRSRLIYMKELGEGHFGKVLLMKAHEIAGFDGKIPVAVKTLSSNKPEVVKQFNEEANLMKELSHPNIIALLGESFEDVDEDNAPLMILEYMPYGDLNNFLTKYRPNSALPAINPLETYHFYSFAADVANGLAFLASSNYIHGDIASRNCLVGPTLIIKISDFGLTKKLEEGVSEYKVEGSAILPLRWLSPETLVFGKFSFASDVWSYGVLLWEITTYGEVPLKELSPTAISDMAEQRVLQHPRPASCPDDLYKIMSQCHQDSPQDRATMTDIVEMLANCHYE